MVRTAQYVYAEKVSVEKRREEEADFAKYGFRKEKTKRGGTIKPIYCLHATQKQIGSGKKKRK